MQNYEVINLKTKASHGKYETLTEARGCVSYDRLTAWEIWRNDQEVVDYRDVRLLADNPHPYGAWKQAGRYRRLASRRLASA